MCLSPTSPRTYVPIKLTYSSSNAPWSGLHTLVHAVLFAFSALAILLHLENFYVSLQAQDKASPL